MTDSPVDPDAGSLGGEPASAYVQPPSEVLGPEALDQALVLLIVTADGIGQSWISSVADAGKVADWLIAAAEEVRSSGAGCDACRDGLPHGHDQA